MTTRKLTRCEIYWDTQDPNNEGWAERATYDDGHQESGPCYGTPANADQSDLEDAVVDLAFLHGTTIEPGDVAVDMHVDGGYAIWDAPECL